MITIPPFHRPQQPKEPILSLNQNRHHWSQYQWQISLWGRANQSDPNFFGKKLLVPLSSGAILSRSKSTSFATNWTKSCILTCQNFSVEGSFSSNLTLDYQRLHRTNKPLSVTLLRRHLQDNRHFGVRNIGGVENPIIPIPLSRLNWNIPTLKWGDMIYIWFPSKWNKRAR